MIHDNQQPEMKGALSLEGGEARWIKALWDSGAKGGYIKSESPVLKDHTLNAYSKTVVTYGAPTEMSVGAPLL